MPSGKFLDESTLEQIWHQRIILERTPLQIWTDSFQSRLLKLKYVEVLCRKCGSCTEVHLFIESKVVRSGGRKHKIDSIAGGFLLEIWEENNKRR
jgi:hypothetical protein